MSLLFFIHIVALLFSFFVAGTILGTVFYVFRREVSSEDSPILTRSLHNPILSPTEHEWENKAVFNPAALALGGRTHLFYRAIGKDGISRFGYASSKNGVTIDERLSEPAYTAQYARIAGAPPIPKYAPALYASGGSWGGCEDGRMVLIEGRVYFMYYSFDADDFVRVTVTSITPEDFLAHRFERFSPPVFLSPPRQIHKNWVLFPEKIGGKFAVLHSIIGEDDHHVRVEYTDDLDELSGRRFESPDPKKVPDKRIAWHSHVRSAGPPPVKTDSGWLVLYHAHDALEPTRYKWGALLLDLAEPTKVIARAVKPVFEPDAPYENDWKPGIAYACGTTVVDGILRVYYGSGEMTVSVASVPLRAFVQALLAGKPSLLSNQRINFLSYLPITSLAKPLSPISKALFTRASENPILSPQGTGFESLGTFNPAAIDIDGSIHLLYRAMSTNHVSTIGYARLQGSTVVEERLPEPIYRPRADFEQKYSHLNSGCEDPRVVLIDDRLYMTYVAAGAGDKARGVLTSISCADFLARRFDAWSFPAPITIEGIDDKDICLLSEKIHGRYVLYHRIHDQMCAAVVDNLLFKERVSRCVEILSPRAGAWDDLKVGIAGPPIKVPSGWLMIYHGLGKGGTYGLGVALLDPSGLQVRARLSQPILTPETLYEKHGEHDNVVFSCGAVVRGDTLYLYYGAADKVVGVATASLTHLLDALS